uniref:Uncharacterized protein n=1 Tax=Candidatus Kentrum sp. TUN TaxID=2126343 RepID=A0A451B4Y6_9GAMM|nr:MAG: hypothetical protein BECKTUN1418F_GA0071002_16571 [Candidatus Kentron sp. TUN]VFK73335.1 MAG: hypothetical protein BECKTUN1418E_GA0071001_16641 [Candidatus Kentron sp. TUN]
MALDKTVGIGLDRAGIFDKLALMTYLNRSSRWGARVEAQCHGFPEQCSIY